MPARFSDTRRSAVSKRRKVSIIVPVVLALVFGTGLISDLRGSADALMSGTAVAQEPSDRRTISVTGEGRVSVTPDTAQVVLGVEIQNADLSAAQLEASQKMDAIIAALKDNGVPEDRIKTINYSVSVQRDYERPGQPITGYLVSHLVQAKIQPMDKVGAIIDAAVSEGANAVRDVAFIVENQDAALRQAREQAVNNARAKAEQLASLIGVSLGAPASITESSAMPPPPIPFREEAAPAAMAGGADASTAIQPVRVRWPSTSRSPTPSSS
jgi:uncharacterized protein YggE